MNLGIVRGSVTAVVKDPGYEGRRIMVVALCRPDWTLTGKETLAVDTVGAGPGDRVLVLKEGNSARDILGIPRPTLQEMIVGILDEGAVHVSE